MGSVVASQMFSHETVVSAKMDIMGFLIWMQMDANVSNLEK